jgi:tetratricopeptide (TPR) repeat protein
VNVNCYRSLGVGLIVGLLVGAMPAILRAQAPAPSGSDRPIKERLNSVSTDLFSRPDAARDAIRELKAILASDPNVAEAHFLLGIAYRMIGNPEMVSDAVAELRQAIALDTNYVPARFYLAQLYLEIGRPERAREEMQTALGQFPGRPQLLAVLGEAERRLKNPRRSAEVLREALKADESFAQARYYLALALFDLGQKDEAIKELERVVQSGPKAAEAYVALGTAYLQANRTDEAIETLTRGIPIDPARPDTRIQLARAYRTKGLLPKADEQLKIARPRATGVSASPLAQDQEVELDYYLELGLLRQQQGQLKEAADALGKVLAMEPGHALASRHLAEVRKALASASTKRPGGSM